MAPALNVNEECSKCLDRLLVDYCAPTLAGVKSSNMFSAFVADGTCIHRHLSYGNGKLNSKGVYLRCLKFRKGRALILVYRRKVLERSIKDPKVRAFLDQEGYADCRDIEECLDHLTEKMLTENCQHEIGIFLGYPLGDVLGFIENGGERPLLAKYWKVYSDEESTRAWFHKMDLVCAGYKRSYQSGNTIDRLTVCQKGA